MNIESNMKLIVLKTENMPDEILTRMTNLYDKL